MIVIMRKVKAEVPRMRISLFPPLALCVQLSAVRFHEAGPHDRIEEENRSKREEDLPDQAQDPKDLHGDAFSASLAKILSQRGRE